MAHAAIGPTGFCAVNFAEEFAEYVRVDLEKEIFYDVRIMRKLLFPAFLMAVLFAANAAPEDHLASAPEATQTEREIIGLLQCEPAGIDTVGTIVINLYNPTKYVLTNCVIRVEISSRGISRIYYSDPATIQPLRDGQFIIRTQIKNASQKELKVTILKVGYEKG